MKYLEPKAPTSTRFYAIDYSKTFVGDTINQSIITVTSGTAIITKQVFNTQSVGFMLSGGATDEESQLSIVIGTAAGQALSDTASIFIIDNEDSVDFSVITKDQVVQWAFQDLRLSGYTFDHTPDEVSAMLARLDGLMREYRLRQMDVGYNHPKQIGLSNLNDIAGFEDGLGMSIATLLAQSYMDGKGKTYTPSMIKKANTAFNLVYSYAAVRLNRVFNPFTPKGAGQKLWCYDPFFNQQFSDNKSLLLNAISGQYIPIGVWDATDWDGCSWG